MTDEQSEFVMRYAGGPPGPRGPSGPPGPRGGVTGRTARAIVTLFLVAFVVGAADLILTVHYVNAQQTAQQQAQRLAGQLIEQKLCKDIGTMARIIPPAGDRPSNPARAYEQDEHQAWAGLYSDLGCKELQP